MKWLLLLAGIGLVLLSFMIPNAVGFPSPELARIVVFHLPCAYAATLFAIWGSIASVRYLQTQNSLWSHRATAANELAFAFACATMTTGILFSKVQWGAWWSWDVRQTTFLIVLMLLAANFAIRASFEDEIPRARASAAYSAISLLPILFLIFVFPKLPQVVKNSLHPAGVVAKMQFDPEYWRAILASLIVLVASGIWLYRNRVKIDVLLEKVKNTNGNLETDRGDSADPSVVRPVSVR